MVYMVSVLSLVHVLLFKLSKIHGLYGFGSFILIDYSFFTEEQRCTKSFRYKVLQWVQGTSSQVTLASCTGTPVNDPFLPTDMEQKKVRKIF
jgi:hypothetical protein